MKKLIATLLATGSMLMFSSNWAATVGVDCATAGSFTLEEIYLADGNPDNPATWVNGAQVWTGSEKNTSCLGVYTSPDNDGPFRPKSDANIGSDGDGLLNGGEGNNGEAAVLTGTEFLANGQTLVNMPDYGIDPTPVVENDPGWLHLASVGEEGGTLYSDSAIFNQLEGPNENITFESLVKFDINGNDWSLMLNPAIVDIGQSLLGANSFDHLAFTIKQCSENTNNPKGACGFAIYDFDFDEIFGNALDKATAYNFFGTFDLSGFHGEEYSHIDVWARDPTVPAAVPVPAAVWLFGSALAGFAGFSRFKKKA